MMVVVPTGIHDDGEVDLGVTDLETDLELAPILGLLVQLFLKLLFGLLELLFNTGETLHEYLLLELIGLGEMLRE